MFKERELRIKEFTEMNAKLNLMKEHFKQELIRSSSQLTAKAEEIERQTSMLERQKMLKKGTGATKNWTRNIGGMARKSIEPSSMERTRYGEISKASKQLPKSIMACRNSIQAIQA